MCAMVNVILDAKNQSFKLCTIDGVDVVILALCFPMELFESSIYLFYCSINTVRKSTML